MNREYGEDSVKCAQCGGENVAEIIYGMVFPSAELEAKLKSGRSVLGGCCIDGDSCRYVCRDCNTRFGELQFFKR